MIHAVIGGKLASSIYECADHGLWRVYISDRIEPYGA
jgi:hypothetical protein